MRKRAFKLVSIGLVGCLLTGLASAVTVFVGPDSISGRVFDSSTDRGIPALSVRLIAPKAAKQPIRVTITNAEGQFEFGKLSSGKYLLTIYRGTELLYRKEIDNRIATTFTVPLRAIPAQTR